MSRVVVISNRVALPGARQTGGLAVSLRQALTGRDAVWLGWSGRLGDDDVLRAETDHGLRLLTFDLGKRDHAEYYNGYVNRVLWPLLHFRTDLMAFDEDEEVAYYRVNRIFARHVASQLRPDDTVWVHDYHLLPLAQELRRLGVTQPIGFFLHVPVAPRDLFATLPGASGLLHSLAAYDHIGVQTRGDLQRLEEVLAGAGMEVRAGVLLHEGRQRTVAAHPIGIDPAAIAHKAERAVRLPAVRTLVTSLSGRALAIGDDHLLLVLFMVLYLTSQMWVKRRCCLAINAKY